MKFMQKLSRLISAVFVLFVCSCKGPQGDPGPNGATGTQGPAGPAGPAGTVGAPGNANVQQISFAARTHTGAADLFMALPAALTTETLDKSLLYVYVKQTVKAGDGKDYAYWFGVPGETSTGNEYSYYLFSGNATTGAGLYLRRVVNYKAGAEAFEAVRVLVIPASSTTNGRMAALNFNDYEAARKAFNLPE